MRGGMISVAARQSFETVLQRAVRARLVLSGEPCAITRVDVRADEVTPDKVTPDEVTPNDSVVALTISSMGFRYMLFLRFLGDAASVRYFASGAADDFRDAVLELGNLCCGAINQELVGHFPDLGMSTPYVLDGHCLHHVDSLKPDYRADFDVTLDAASGEAVLVGVTMCLFTRVPIDFHAGHEVEMATSDGELELF
ncbi:hypothetical protein [Cupriavidus pampae]|uniref:Chemotaxis protein CheX n=1 Tax=Cupriavidus pampae TaxID=659251 RepID=A0ABM8WGM1_9BURK|nr:hypothetical protein [Cupriavidus pampae]CAG9166492.1 hypothetical protein LMG32289_01035 [Cupriavidus pampae]